MTIPSSGPVTFTDIQTEFGGTNPIALNEYYAGGGLVPAGTTGTYGPVPSSGQISVQNFYGTTAFTPVYIEEVFQTWLYNGTGSTQTITNGIDFATKGGLVWIKARNDTASHQLIDTVRGGTKILSSNTTAQEGTVANAITSFNSNGFTMGSYSNINFGTGGPWNYASWSFEKAPKFFDVVTFTAGTNTNRRISHSLDSVPGFWILKSITIDGANWDCYHTSLGLNASINLNLSNAAGSGSNRWGTAPTSTTLGINEQAMCSAGYTYILYIFANNAGGFGATGSDNVITCGGYSGSSSAQEITLGYEPQWILFKCTSSSSNSDWVLVDVMRGMDTPATGTLYRAPWLLPNTSDAEQVNNVAAPTPTGFIMRGNELRFNANGRSYIYIAIRRGPMKVPTVGTSVLGLNARGGSGANATVTGSAGVTDLAIVKNRGSTPVWLWASRLTGTGYLSSNATTTETAADTTILQANPWDVMDGVKVGTTSTITNQTSNTFINYLFDRASGFMDVVCYTGTDTARTITHNLTTAPELIIVKDRSLSRNWYVYASGIGNTKYLNLNNTNAPTTDSTVWNNTSPTSSVFSLGSSSGPNGSGETFVAYLFATCAGVSKVGSYTGNGTNGRVIDCGFTSGARFILIKKTSNTGDWAVWDTARGITSGNDPVLAFNSTAAEYVDGDQVDPDSTGFIVNTAGGFNLTGETYIFLAIA
jgi:hypothetical protein